MKTLLLLRHAKSSWDNPALGDHERVLNKRGQRDAPRMGRLIADEEIVPDCIVSSTASRARATAELVAEECGFSGEIQFVRELYHAPPSAYFSVLSQLPIDRKRVLVVAHNPGIEELQLLLTGEFESMPTAALAQIELNIDAWKQFDRDCEARLLHFWRPKELQ
jgi:phosphohistidine phosphatase